MNTKRFLMASLAVFVVSRALDFLVHGVLLRGAYDSLRQLWRPDMQAKMWILWVIGILVAPLFTYIFVKGYEGKGIGEGVRFGLIIGLFTSIPMAYGTYVILAIPYYLALQWFLYGTVEAIVLGVVASAVYKPSAASA